MLTKLRELAEAWAATADLCDQQANWAIEPEREAFHCGYSEGSRCCADALTKTIEAIQVFIPLPVLGGDGDGAKSK